MRLVSFGEPGAEKPGALIDGGILDLSAHAPRFGSMREIIASGSLDAVHATVASANAGDSRLIPLEGTRLGPPITDPTKILCIGLNYADHAAEQNRPLPKAPLVFCKAPSALVGHGDTIVLPAHEDRVDVEAELACVIGRRARNVAADNAYDYVAGYMCFNDVSGRAAQYSDRQWFRGKSFDTFAPCGPWLVTRDEIDDPHALAIGSQWNDRVMQQSNTDQLVFGVPQLIEYISRGMTLMPGDIIATGTPAGVGVFRDPPVFLTDGDRVEISIERLGTLSNPVRTA